MLKVKVVEQVRLGLQLVGLNGGVVTPEGRLETEKVTFWVAPDNKVAVTAVEVELPRATVAAAGLAEREKLKAIAAVTVAVASGGLATSLLTLIRGV